MQLQTASENHAWKNILNAENKVQHTNSKNTSLSSWKMDTWEIAIFFWKRGTDRTSNCDQPGGGNVVDQSAEKPLQPADETTSSLPAVQQQKSEAVVPLEKN